MVFLIKIMYLLFCVIWQLAYEVHDRVIQWALQVKLRELLKEPYKWNWGYYELAFTDLGETIILNLYSMKYLIYESIVVPFIANIYKFMG